MQSGKKLVQGTSGRKRLISGQAQSFEEDLWSTPQCRCSRHSQLCTRSTCWRSPGYVQEPHVSRSLLRSWPAFRNHSTAGFNSTTLHFLGEKTMSRCGKNNCLCVSGIFMKERIDCAGFALKSSEAGVCVRVSVRIRKPRLHRQQDEPKCRLLALDDACTRKGHCSLLPTHVPLKFPIRKKLTQFNC